MSRERHQCTHPVKCDSPAEWEMHLRFWTTGVGLFRIEVKCVSTIRVCGKHIRAAEHRLKGPRNKQLMASWMTRQHLPVPDFDSFEITWRRLAHDDIVNEIMNEALSGHVEDTLRQQ